MLPSDSPDAGGLHCRCQGLPSPYRRRESDLSEVFGVFEQGAAGTLRDADSEMLQNSGRDPSYAISNTVMWRSSA